jgi:hypothetical protein
MKEYVDTTRIRIDVIDKTTAKNVIVKYHYSHAWTSCRYSLGIFYEDSNRFFENSCDNLIGVIVYGYPIGRRVVKSISESLDGSNVLELTRLFIHDGYGSNIESYSISKSFEWLKVNSPQTKVIISYSDPEQGHVGTIYQAINGYYQGNSTRLVDAWWYRFPDSNLWIHPRSVVNKFKSIDPKVLLKYYPDGYEIKELKRKHRYIFFICDKREKRRLISELKHPILPYPKKETEHIEIVTKITKDNLK